MPKTTERDATMFEANGALLRGALLRGSLSAVPIAQAAAADTLLSFAIGVDDSPARVGATARLTLTVSNLTRQEITCTRIVIALPIGENGKELTADATGIGTTVPDGWDLKGAGGVFTLTPTGDAGTIGGKGLAFVFSRIKVNDEPGRALIRVTETASSPAAPTPTARGTTIPVDKFPARFTLSDLMVISPPSFDVPNGGTATLMWNGSESATYTLSYQPADSGTPVEVTSPEIGGSGPYVTVPLTRSGSVMFTLTALVKVPGQDQPLRVHRLAGVSIRSLAIRDFAAEPAVVAVNGLTRLSWDAPNAAYCTLGDERRLPPSGQLLVIVAKDKLLTLTAVGADGARVHKQFGITVDASIRPTEPGHSARGKDGDAGSNATEGTRWFRGGNGGDGTDAALTLVLPPLDTAAAGGPVVPITVVAGNGGRGGNGYYRNAYGMSPGDGGNGGRGGNATLEIRFDPAAGPPAQYIITAVAGRGGAGGPPGHRNGAKAGTAGADGVLTFTIDGVTPVLIG